MKTIKEYIAQLRKIMMKNNYNLDNISEYQLFLENEFEDFKAENLSSDNKLQIEEIFINQLEIPEEIAKNLGTPTILSLKNVLLQLFPLYLLLMGVFLFLYMTENLFIGNHNLEDLWYWIRWIIVFIDLLIWLITPTIVVYYQMMKKIQFNRINIRKYDLFTLLMLYICATLFFLFYTFLVGPSQLKPIGGKFGLFILWTIIFILVIIWRRKQLQQDIRSWYKKIKELQ